MNGVSCDICVYHLGLFAFLPGVFLSSRVTGACPVTTDLVMRVNVRTTTTTTTTTTTGGPRYYFSSASCRCMHVYGCVRTYLEVKI